MIGTKNDVLTFQYEKMSYVCNALKQRLYP